MLTAKIIFLPFLSLLYIIIMPLLGVLLFLYGVWRSLKMRAHNWLAHKATAYSNP